MREMIKLILLVFILFVPVTGCYTSKKNISELGGLMMLESTQLSRNKAYYTPHNKKIRKHAPRDYEKVARKNKKIRYVKNR